MPPWAILNSGRHPGRQLDQFMVEEGDAGFQAPGHGHVVDPLHRVVDQHDRGVHAQGLVDAKLGAVLGEMVGDEFAAGVAVHEARMDGFRELIVIAVEEDLRVVAGRIVAALQRRIPVVSGEDLVGALAALDHGDVFRNLARKQVESRWRHG